VRRRVFFEGGSLCASDGCPGGSAKGEGECLNAGIEEFNLKGAVFNRSALPD
jgi:hypothetical protein